MKQCSQCAYHAVGPLSGMGYCTARKAWEFAHAMRLESGPCGPEARLFLGPAAPVQTSTTTETRKAA